MVLSFPILADYAWVEAGGKLLYLTHGHHISEATYTRIGAGNVLLSGHTHVPKCEIVSGVLHLNPGSTSIPKEGSVKSYMTFDGKTFLWKNLENGDVYSEKQL